MNERLMFNLVDLAGTFAFAISGATAARRRNLDLFGILAIAYITACGGGIVRDLCIGAIPPAGLSDWRYLLTAVVAALLTILAYRWVERLTYPVRLFDAMGLGLFAVYGANKALAFGHNAEVAILLGMVTAIGGGVARDVLLARVSVVLQKEIYALAALAGAALAVIGEYLHWPVLWATWLPILLCFALRILSLYFHWNLPRFGSDPQA
ncbi:MULTISPECIES: trimeric intracellular cation channel family protein [Rhodanobacter]|uniref:trimeric intracellular cation channel family protein n=1 Tax=Rhodanobacter TaxID=75309 RepID=UPI0004214ED0|nr:MULTISPECIES: trimeric intracellular cation channel family protein [Rhodanobacter]TAN18902.1 MAG: trimeric intracellular cation channel family protein [Rhodanobacter sp.]UJJ55610.1 trimeric intracellular cation channel family protein [Rhodanobacter thiooxydans]